MPFLHSIIAVPRYRQHAATDHCALQAPGFGRSALNSDCKLERYQTSYKPRNPGREAWAEVWIGQTRNPIGKTRQSRRFMSDAMPVRTVQRKAMETERRRSVFAGPGNRVAGAAHCCLIPAAGVTGRRCKMPQPATIQGHWYRD
jgi:hypothetical protein